MKHQFTVTNFSLKDTLECGQCFRFSKISENKYFIISDSHSATISQINNLLMIESNTDIDYWKHYFDLSTDYAAILNKFDGDPYLEQAKKQCGTIHILNQNKWETLISFIISANNNIPRIKGILQRLCELLGQPIDQGYSFPSPEAIAQCSEQDLAPLRAGFRTKYILDAAQKVSSAVLDLEQLNRMDIDSARNALQQINGVGPKVSECVLLFGFHFMQAFPIDVWMRRVLNEQYPNGLSRQVLTCPGLAQQILFCYERNYKARSKKTVADIAV